MEHLDILTAHRLIRGQLDASAQVQWRRHMEQCAHCRDLVTSERAFARVVDLSSQPAPAAAASVDAVLDRVPHFGPHRTRARRQQIAMLIAEVVLIVGLSGLLWWELRRGSAATEALDSDLRISSPLQEQVIANLAALEVLERDPWLIDQYEAVRALERLITERPQ
jgi:hypothetical protein